MYGIFAFVACSHTAVYLCLVAVVDKIGVLLWFKTSKN